MQLYTKIIFFHTASEQTNVNTHVKIYTNYSNFFFNLHYLWVQIWGYICFCLDTTINQFYDNNQLRTILTVPKFKGT